MDLCNYVLLKLSAQALLYSIIRGCMAIFGGFETKSLGMGCTF